MSVLLIPPIAFVLYIVLVGILSGLGKLIAEPNSPPNTEKTKSYTGGENLPLKVGVPGYKPFFVTALFFAVLHLGVLMLGSAIVSPITVLYLAGLILALLALILG
jgi:NADH:ubiquinone oxidoreductase subunit 3 (subunit A)